MALVWCMRTTRKPEEAWWPLRHALSLIACEISLRNVVREAWLRKSVVWTLEVD